MVERGRRRKDARKSRKRCEEEGEQEWGKESKKKESSRGTGLGKKRRDYSRRVEKKEGLMANTNLHTPYHSKPKQQRMITPSTHRAFYFVCTVKCKKMIECSCCHERTHTYEKMG